MTESVTLYSKFLHISWQKVLTYFKPMVLCLCWNDMFGLFFIYLFFSVLKWQVFGDTVSERSTAKVKLLYSIFVFNQIACHLLYVTIFCWHLSISNKSKINIEIFWLNQPIARQPSFPFAALVNKYLESEQTHISFSWEYIDLKQLSRCRKVACNTCTKLAKYYLCVLKKPQKKYPNMIDPNVSLIFVW